MGGILPQPHTGIPSPLPGRGVPGLLFWGPVPSYQSTVASDCCRGKHLVGLMLWFLVFSLWGNHLSQVSRCYLQTRASKQNSGTWCPVTGCKSFQMSWSLPCPRDRARPRQVRSLEKCSLRKVCDFIVTVAIVNNSDNIPNVVSGKPSRTNHFL